MLHFLFCGFTSRSPAEADPLIIFEEYQDEETLLWKPKSFLAVAMEEAGGSTWHQFSVHRVGIDGLITLPCLLSSCLFNFGESPSDQQC